MDGVAAGFFAFPEEELALRTLKRMPGNEAYTASVYQMTMEAGE